MTVSPVLEEDEEDEDTVDDQDPLLMQLHAVSHASYQTTPSHSKVDPAKVRKMNVSVRCSFILYAPLYQSTDSAAVMSQPAEERGHGRITTKTYYRYFTTEGGHLLTLLVLVVFIAAEVTYLWRVSESQY